MRRQDDLSRSKLLEELSVWKEKIQELEHLVKNSSNGISVRDLARRAGKIFENGAKKMRAVEKMASEQQERR